MEDMVSWNTQNTPDQVQFSILCLKKKKGGGKKKPSYLLLGNRKDTNLVNHTQNILFTCMVFNLRVTGVLSDNFSVHYGHLILSRAGIWTFFISKEKNHHLQM